MKKRLVICISGASGVIYGIRILQIIKELQSQYNLESYLILSKFAIYNIKIETDYSLEDVTSLADFYYVNNDLSAIIASGSFFFHSVIVIPCSMKTLSSISHGFEDNLITRVSHVSIKEKRHLILAVREMPINSIHIQNMLTLSNLGVYICPIVISFYNRPTTIENIVDYFLYRILDLIDIRIENVGRWKENISNNK